MSSHNLPGEVKRKKLTKALIRLGFVLNESGGDGSHYKIVWKNEKSITIPYNISKNVLRYLLKEIKDISGVTWEDIQKEL